MYRIVFVASFLIFAASCDQAAESVNEIQIRRQFGKQAEQKLKDAAKAIESGDEIPLPEGNNAKARLDKVKLHALINYIGMYRLKHNRYPDTLDELTVDLSISEDSITNPFGCKYQMAEQENGLKIRVLSLGADCQEGGEELDADVAMLHPPEKSATDSVPPSEHVDSSISADQNESQSSKPSFTFGPSQSEKVSVQLEKAELLELLNIGQDENIKVVPYFRSGKQIGVRVFTTGAKSNLPTYGMKSGDILLAMNDNRFNMHLERV